MALQVVEGHLRDKKDGKVGRNELNCTINVLY